MIIYDLKKSSQQTKQKPLKKPKPPKSYEMEQKNQHMEIKVSDHFPYLWSSLIENILKNETETISLFLQTFMLALLFNWGYKARVFSSLGVYEEVQLLTVTIRWPH